MCCFVMSELILGGLEGYYEIHNITTLLTTFDWLIVQPFNFTFHSLQKVENLMIVSQCVKIKA